MKRNEIASGAIRWQVRVGTRNRKLGRSAVVVTLDARTCPPDCPLRDGGCYAESGPLSIAWNQVNRGEAKDDGRARFAGSGFVGLSRRLRNLAPTLSPGSLVRIGDAGDPSIDGRIPAVLVDALVYLRKYGHRPIVYTHASDSPWNRRMAARARMGGVTLNRSMHGPVDLPAARDPWERVTTVPESFWGSEGDDGRIVQCPAETRPAVDCESCGWCARGRGYAIGFTAHGARKALVETVSE